MSSAFSSLLSLSSLLISSGSSSSSSGSSASCGSSGSSSTCIIIMIMIMIIIISASASVSVSVSVSSSSSTISCYFKKSITVCTWHNINVRNLLGWLETRLAQTTPNQIILGFVLFYGSR